MTRGFRDGAQVSGLTEGCTMIDSIHIEEEAQTYGEDNTDLKGPHPSGVSFKQFEV